MARFCTAAINRLCNAQIFLDSHVAVHILALNTITAASGEDGETRRKGPTPMSNGFDSMQGFGKENVDLALKSADAVGKGLQAIAAEVADYSKRSLDASASAFEKLLAAQSLDKAVEVQSDFVRLAYEGYVGQIAKVTEIVADMAKGAYKPYEAFFGKLGK